MGWEKNMKKHVRTFPSDVGSTGGRPRGWPHDPRWALHRRPRGWRWDLLAPWNSAATSVAKAGAFGGCCSGDGDDEEDDDDYTICRASNMTELDLPLASSNSATARARTSLAVLVKGSKSFRKKLDIEPWKWLASSKRNMAHLATQNQILWPCVWKLQDPIKTLKHPKTSKFDSWFQQMALKSNLNWESFARGYLPHQQIIIWKLQTFSIIIPQSSQWFIRGGNSGGVLWMKPQGDAGILQDSNEKMRVPLARSSAAGFEYQQLIPGA